MTAFANVMAAALGGVNAPTPGSQATAFLARTTGLNTTQRNAYINLINGLVADGDWPKFDVLHVYATNSRSNALLNLVSTSFTGVEHGAVNFTPNVGYAGNASDFYIDTQFNASTAGGNYVSGSGALGVYVANTRTTGQNWGVIGAQNSTGTLFQDIVPKFTDNNAYAQFNNNSSVATADARGLWVGTWTSATVGALWKNGTSVATGTAAAGLINANIMVFAEGKQGASPILFTRDTISCIFISSGTINVANVSARIQAFMNALGINVFNTAMPSSPPIQAQLAGYKSIIFADDFASLSTIDTTNSKVAGFKWYTGTYPWQNTVLTPTPLADYSIASSAITITDNPNPSLGGYEFGTRTYLGVSNPRTVGLPAFTAGFYWEARMLFNSAQHNATSGPAIWMQDINGTLALADNNTTAVPDFGEIDMIEWLPNGASSNLFNPNVIEWINNVATNQNPNRTNGMFSPDSNWHTYGFLWIPAATNGGTGYFIWYVDGCPVGSSTVKYGPTGNFVIHDTGQFQMFFDTAAGQTMQIDYIVVCQ